VCAEIHFPAHGNNSCSYKVRHSQHVNALRLSYLDVLRRQPELKCGLRACPHSLRIRCLMTQVDLPTGKCRHSNTGTYNVMRHHALLDAN
jgi:hypothetical protein